MCEQYFFLSLEIEVLLEQQQKIYKKYKMCSQ